MLNKMTPRFQVIFEVIQKVQLSETTRNIIDLSSFALGFIGIYNLIKTYYFRNRKIDELNEKLPFWQQKARKITDFLGNLSLVLGGLKSRQSIAILKWSVHKITSYEQLQSLLGSQHFIHEEKILRTIGLLSLLLGIPSTLRTSYMIYSWAKRQDSSNLEEKNLHYLIFLPIRTMDIALNMKTVSYTIQNLFSTSPHLHKCP
jgi:hypothetical protein